MAKGKKDSAVEHAYDAVRNYIIDHHLNVGDVLPVEAVFAKQLGISRLTLREAMGRFHALGIIESIQKVGPVIRRLFPEDPYRSFFPFLAQQGERVHLKLAEWRSCLEIGAAYSMTQNRTSADLKRLRRILTALEACTDPENDTSLEFQFHSALLESTHNEFIISQVPLIRNLLNDVTKNHPPLPETTRQSDNRGHRMLFDALKARDHVKLTEILTAHTRNYVRLLEGHVTRDPVTGAVIEKAPARKAAAVNNKA